MLTFLSNPFTDPNDPWYYVIGVLFLLLIFGALALYLILSKKKAKIKPPEDEEIKSDNAQSESDEAQKTEEKQGTEEEKSNDTPSE